MVQVGLRDIISVTSFISIDCEPYRTAEIQSQMEHALAQGQNESRVACLQKNFPKIPETRRDKPT